MKDTHTEKASASSACEEAAPDHSLQFKADIRGMSVGQQLQAVRPAAPVQFAGSAAGTAAVHQAAAEGISGSSRSLPHLVDIQNSFGRHDVSQVDAYVGGAAEVANDKMGSVAYATGNAVAFKGSPDLHTAAHEAAHVVQQRAGVSVPGGVGQVGDAYERHADAVADAVVQGKNAEPILDQMAGGEGGGASVQAKAVQMHGDHSEEGEGAHEETSEETTIPKWSDMDWKDLTSAQQTNWKVLGWNAERWDTNDPPASESKIWSALSTAEKAAAKKLGYTSKAWNDELPTSTKADLDKVVGDETYEKGSVKHQTPKEADAAIKKHLGDYVKKACAAGRKITGQVAVVDDAEWDKAGEYHYGYTKWHAKRSGSSHLYRDSINGFVDKHERVWIHKDRGNPGTMIHEAVHKYSDSAMIGISQPLNEGVTEYFTRVVCKAAKITTTRRNYQSNWKTVVKLAALVGEDKLAKAFFDGDTAGLKSAYVAKKSAADWTVFITATKGNKWSDANAKL